MAKKQKFINNEPIPIIESTLLNQKMAFMKHTKELFFDIVKAHIETKFFTGEMCGNARHYHLANQYGVLPGMTDSMKVEVMKEVVAEFPDQPLEWRKERCQIITYNRWLDLYSENESKFNQNQK